MTDSSRPVMAAAAEVTGMAMKVMAEQETDDESKQWQNKYADNVDKLLQGFLDNRLDSLLTCVHRMSLHYAPIAERFVAIYNEESYNYSTRNGLE
jgi:hypothetical protein